MRLTGTVLTPAQIAAAPYTTLKQIASRRHRHGRRERAARSSAPTVATGSPTDSSSASASRSTASGPWTIIGVFDDNNDSKFERLLLGNGPLLASRAGSVAHDVRSVVRVVTGGDVPVVQTVPITIVGGPYGGYVTRTDGPNWKDFGFMEGQHVRIQGIDGSWRLRRIQDGPGCTGCVCGSTRGVALPTIAVAQTRMVYWPGPHGGLTVVHGGGNSQLKINFQIATTGSPDGATATVSRQDGSSWFDSGFNVGDRIQVASSRHRSRGRSRNSSTATARSTTRSRVADSTRRSCCIARSRATPSAAS